MSRNGFRCFESQQIKTCWAKPYETFWQQEASKQCPKNFQVLSTQWPGLHKRTRFDPSCINRLRFSWARNKKIRKRRHFGIMMARLMLLLLLIAPLTLTSYADSGQKVIKLKIYIAFSFRRDTLKWPFGPFSVLKNAMAFTFPLNILSCGLFGLHYRCLWTRFWPASKSNYYASKGFITKRIVIQSNDSEVLVVI